MPKASFTTELRTALPGSSKARLPQVTEVKPLTGGGSITVSVLVRRKTPLATAGLGEQRLTRAQYRAQHSADPAALRAVRAFAKEFSLTTEHDPNRRIVSVTGSAANIQKAFGVKLGQHKSADGNTYRIREGEICLPDSLTGQVEAVLGLDNRPQAKPHFRIANSGNHIGQKTARQPAKGSGIANPRAVTNSYTPVQVAELYGLPLNRSGAGQTIGIIELGGGYKTADITAYFKNLGQTPPKVTAVSVDKGKNKSDGPNGADGEVMLDIEVAAAVAPGAGIVVYFAPNTDQGFVDAIATAIHDTVHKPSVISISWGGPEASWTAQAMNALDAACQSAAALGITVLVAAGDDGATDGVADGKKHVDFPGSSPHVLCCGGTKLVGNGSIQSEVVWNELANKEGATGGGISTFFPQPAWQSGIAATKSGRGVPDVCGNADPTTGYQIRVDGQDTVIGGTSAVAPLWAGLVAVANAQNKTTAGFLQPRLYAGNGANGFRDITQGDNGGYSAGPGWDPCTGLGSPNLPNLLGLLAPAKATRPPSKKPGKPKAA